MPTNIDYKAYCCICKMNVHQTIVHSMVSNEWTLSNPLLSNVYGYLKPVGRGAYGLLRPQMPCSGNICCVFLKDLHEIHCHNVACVLSQIWQIMYWKILMFNFFLLTRNRSPGTVFGLLIFFSTMDSSKCLFHCHFFTCKMLHSLTWCHLWC